MNEMHGTTSRLPSTVRANAQARLRVIVVLWLAALGFVTSACNAPAPPTALPPTVSPAAPTIGASPSRSTSAPTPASPTPRTYVFGNGDTPVRIAHEFGLSVQELQDANPGVDLLRSGVDDPALPNYEIGTVLVIPDPSESPAG